MLDGKLRIAPTCYHVLHQVPVMTAHEMNFLYDEGLQAEDGSPAYTILHDSMVPFGLEKLGISQAMKELRHEHGALDLRTLEPHALVTDGEIVGLEQDLTNCARELIEDFMIGANGVSARYLDERRSPSLRRVVRMPKRWNRIVEVAAEQGEALPAEPNAVALARFLRKRREADPLRFPDLSLTIVNAL